MELIRAAVWPAPVQRVDLTVSSADRPEGAVHTFTAAVSTADEPLSKERIRALVLGNDPVGLLLAKRIEAGDPIATRIVDGVGAAAAAAYKKLGLDRGAPPAASREPGTLADAVVGLQAAVTHDESGTVVRLLAEVPAGRGDPGAPAGVRRADPAGGARADRARGARRAALRDQPRVGVAGARPPPRR